MSAKNKISSEDTMIKDFYADIEKLGELSRTGAGSVPNARALFKMYNQIEALLLYGFTVKGLTGELNRYGFNFTEKSLKTELFRIRKRLDRESPRIILNKIESEFGYSGSYTKIVELFNRDYLIFRDYKKTYEFKNKAEKAAV